MKPRLRKSWLGWECIGGGGWATGHTPEHAYKAWKISADQARNVFAYRASIRKPNRLERWFMEFGAWR